MTQQPEEQNRDDEALDPAAQDPDEANEKQQGRDAGSGGAAGEKQEEDLPTSDQGQPYQPDPLGNPGGPEREESV